ncbi:MAG: hypothetical protein MUE85_23445, partial [Microscillaceae bacterium]|nr:hypothetical protein [Microscillaceae bacterium]
MPTPNEDNFEEQWRDAFDDAELEPSPIVWAGLEPHLPKSPWAAWFRYVGLGLVVLGLMVGGYFLSRTAVFNSSQNTDNQVVSQNSDSNFNLNKDSQSIDNQLVTKNSDSNFNLNKDSQSIDNQLVTKNSDSNFNLNKDSQSID